jgi:hypothetical protein
VVTWAKFAAGRGLPTLLASSTIAAVLCTTIGVPTVVRAPIVVGFIAAGPGLALVRVMKLGGLPAVAMLSVGLSLALAGIVGTAQVYAGLWSPIALLAILASLTMATILADPWLAGRAWDSTASRLRTQLTAVLVAVSGLLLLVGADGWTFGSPGSAVVVGVVALAMVAVAIASFLAFVARGSFQSLVVASLLPSAAMPLIAGFVHATSPGAATALALATGFGTIAAVRVARGGGWGLESMCAAALVALVILIARLLPSASGLVGVMLLVLGGGTWLIATGGRRAVGLAWPLTRHRGMTEGDRVRGRATTRYVPGRRVRMAQPARPESPGHDEVRRPAATDLRREIWRLPALLAIALSLALWLSGLGGIDVERMNDLGLISVLPAQVILAVFVLSVSMFASLLRREPHGLVPALHVVALVAILFATPVIAEGLPAGTTTYLHSGFAEYIARTGTLAVDLDARFDWPGFFVLTAAITQLAGLDSALAFASWAPVAFNLLFVVALWLLYRGLGLDWRLAWAAIWLFELGNWIGQDYFAPQALAYFLYLAILAAAVAWFRNERPRVEAVARILRSIPALGRLAARLYDAIEIPERASRIPPPEGLASAILAIVVLFTFVAISHQLTPFLTVMALLALAIMNHISIGRTAVLLGVIATAWVSYATLPFLSGHLAALLAQIGQLGRTVSQNVTGRIVGSADHQLILSLRLGFTLALWASAGLGVLIRMRRGQPVGTLVIVAAAPLPLVAFQGYGGELVLRLYLFSLPVVAVFVAGAVFREGQPVRSWIERGIVVLALAIMSVSFFATRYGNERSDAVTPLEFDAVSAMYDIAPPGSLLVTAYDAPWKFEKVELYSYVSISQEFVTGNEAGLVSAMSSLRYPAAYLLLTRREEAFGEMFSGLDPTAWDAFVAKVDGEPRLQLLYRNDDAALWSVVRAAGP